MGVELIAHDDETGFWIGLDETLNMLSKVDFGPGVGNGGADEFACGQMDIGNEDLSAMSAIVELSAFDLVWLSRQGCPIPLKSLDARFFIDADHVNTSRFILFLRCHVQFTDLLDLLGKLVPVLNIGVLPIPAAMRL